MCTVARASPMGGSGPPSSSVSFELDGRVLRPWSINTPEFGSAWGAHSVEKKIRVPSPALRNLNDLMSRMASLQFHPVEAITKSTLG